MRRLRTSRRVGSRFLVTSGSGEGAFASWRAVSRPVCAILIWKDSLVRYRDYGGLYGESKGKKVL